MEDSSNNNNNQNERQYYLRPLTWQKALPEYDSNYIDAYSAFTLEGEYKLVQRANERWELTLLAPESHPFSHIEFTLPLIDGIAENSADDCYIMTAETLEEGKQKAWECYRQRMETNVVMTRKEREIGDQARSAGTKMKEAFDNIKNGADINNGVMGADINNDIMSQG